MTYVSSKTIHSRMQWLNRHWLYHDHVILLRALVFARLLHGSEMIDGHATNAKDKIDHFHFFLFFGNSQGLLNETYLGCSMSKFSSGDVSTLTGSVEVKHGGGVTYHDSSIELGTGDDGNKLNAPS